VHAFEYTGRASVFTAQEIGQSRGHDSTIGINVNTTVDALKSREDVRPVGIEPNPNDSYWARVDCGSTGSKCASSILRPSSPPMLTHIERRDDGHCSFYRLVVIPSCATGKSMCEDMAEIG
jgi:hypothetical protein